MRRLLALIAVLVAWGIEYVMQSANAHALSAMLLR